MQVQRNGVRSNYDVRAFQVARGNGIETIKLGKHYPPSPGKMSPRIMAGKRLYSGYLVAQTLRQSDYIIFLCFFDVCRQKEVYVLSRGVLPNYFI